TDDPDIPRTFAGGCADFQDALRQVSHFDEVPPDFPWLWCGGPTLTASGPPPDLDTWLETFREIGLEEWQQNVVDPFLACAVAASKQFQALSEHFEQAKEGAIAASGDQLEARLWVSQALQDVPNEEGRRQEEQAQRLKRLYDLLSAAAKAARPITPN